MANKKLQEAIDAYNRARTKESKLKAYEKLMLIEYEELKKNDAVRH